MTTSTRPEFELSPLDQIRQTEAEVARRIASAREAGEQRVVKAKAEARTIVSDAREAGQREGQKRYKEIVSSAEEEAQTLIAQAYRQAEFLRSRGRQRLKLGTHQALHIILGLEVEGEGR